MLFCSFLSQVALMYIVVLVLFLKCTCLHKKSFITSERKLFQRVGWDYRKRGNVNTKFNDI